MSITDVLLNNFLNMRMNVLKSIAFASMLAMAACSTDMADMDGDRENALSLGPGEDIIRISMTNTTSRAARPIGSSEALNNVNRIAFKFLKKDESGKEVEAKITLVGVIDENGDPIKGFDVKKEVNVLVLTSTLPEYNEEGNGIRVKFSGMTEGVYRIIAYGYNCAGEVVDFPYGGPALAGGNLQKYYQVTGVTQVEEIFAGYNGDGSNYVGVNEFGKFETVPAIKLTRQVAGLLAYFKNAPAFVKNTKVAKVTVSGRAKVTGFTFPASLSWSSEGYNGYSPDDSWVQGNWVHYLTFNMKGNADNYESADNGDTYTFTGKEGKFLLAEENNASIPGLVCNENTLFGSCFMLPYPRYNDFAAGENALKCATLNICYWDKDNNLILSVPLKNNEETQYGIKCNNFYSIGKKTKLEGDPAHPDEPIDIQETTGYDHANVSIDSEWIHNNLVK